jgi:hypothetical protein
MIFGEGNFVPASLNFGLTRHEVSTKHTDSLHAITRLVDMVRHCFLSAKEVLIGFGGAGRAPGD